MPTKKPTLINDLNSLRDLLLRQRGWTLADLTADFNLADFTPSALGIKKSSLNKALARLQIARDHHQDVLIFGDYDVDGNCATAVMWLGLRDVGITARPFIPHRLHHGYGMSVKALQEIFAAQKPDLIITVDNGITAVPALRYCQEQGVDVIVTDHHAPDAVLTPPALATIATSQLSGTGVAWFVIFSLWQKLGLPDLETRLTALLDLVALATVVDQVPLTSLNRCLVKAGITALRHTSRAGLVALCQCTHTPPAQLTSRDIGFTLGPRINAIGRLTHDLSALRLLCTAKSSLATKLATSLNNINRDRQQLTTDMFELAQSQINPRQLPNVIVVASPDFHEGIIGLIASKLTDLYHRPAIAINLNPDLAKASARSVGNFNIIEFLRQFRDDFIDVGGHAAAAGFSFLPAKLAAIKSKITSASTQQINPNTFLTPLTATAAVTFSLLNDPQLATLYQALEPFGAGNESPLLQITGRLVSHRALGSDQQHLRLNLVDETGVFLPVLFWHAAEQHIVLPPPNSLLTIIGEVKFDDYYGKKTVALVGKDLKIA